MPVERGLTVSRIVRAVFATATLIGIVVAVVVGDEPRWFVFAGTCGVIWWMWDILVEHVLGPGGDWVLRLLTGQEIGERVENLRPTLEDTVRLLESHLEHGASRQVCINAAIRLEEIYRTVKDDPVRARQVIERVREQYPEAPELERWLGKFGDAE